MSSTDLFAPREPGSQTISRPPSPPKKRSLPPWILPAFLVAAFAALFGWFFRDQLLPSHPVEVAPVLLLTDLDSDQAAETSAASTQNQPSTSVEEENASDFAAPMLFQAAGWFEPDPLPIRATALVDGVIQSVHVLEGETVSKGQVLARLIAEDVDLQLATSKRALEEIVAEHHMHLATIPAADADVQSVRSQIKAANVKLEELNDRYQRIANLSAGTVSDQDVTAARLAVESQRAEIASLEADLAAKEAALNAITTQNAVFEARIAAAEVAISQNELARSRIDILSPVDGVVLELKAAPGQKKMLAMDEPDSATIAVLFETGKLQARVDVPLSDARGLVPGQAAIITSDFLPNTEFRGRVTRIVGAADLQRNTLQAKVRVLDPHPGLRPEMLCRVKFLDPQTALQNPTRPQTASASTSPLPGSSPATASGAQALFAPLSAIAERADDQATVWAVSPKGDRALLKEIILTNLELDGHVRVQEGLLAGELLILPPHTELTNGRRIHVVSSHP